MLHTVLPFILPVNEELPRARTRHVLFRRPPTLYRLPCSAANTMNCALRAFFCVSRGAPLAASEGPRLTGTPPARHRGTALRTSRAATAAKSARARLSSMIALVAVTHFAAEHPVRQRRVEKNDWQDDDHTDEQENLA